jgi:hypothetical protein
MPPLRIQWKMYFPMRMEYCICYQKWRFFQIAACNRIPDGCVRWQLMTVFGCYYDREGTLILSLFVLCPVHQRNLGLKCLVWEAHPLYARFCPCVPLFDIEKILKEQFELVSAGENQMQLMCLISYFSNRGWFSSCYEYWYIWSYGYLSPLCMGD